MSGEFSRRWQRTRVSSPLDFYRKVRWLQKKGSRDFFPPTCSEVWWKCSKFHLSVASRAPRASSALCVPRVFAVAENRPAVFGANPSKCCRTQARMTARGKPGLIFHIQIQLKHHKYCWTDVTVHPSYPNSALQRFHCTFHSNICLFNEKSKMSALQHQSTSSVLFKIFQVIFF